MTDQTPVETGAQGIHAGEYARGETVRPWAEVPDHARAAYRDEARDALSSLAQHRDDIARVLGGKCISDAAAEAAADAVLAYLTGGAR